MADQPASPGRRRFEVITPVPQPKKKGRAAQAQVTFTHSKGLSNAEVEYNPTFIINEIRQ